MYENKRFYLQTRCGSSALSKPPSKSILASSIKLVLPMEPKQELVHMNNTKVCY